MAVNVDHIVKALTAIAAELENIPVEFGPRPLFVFPCRIGNAKLTLKMGWYPDSIRDRAKRLQIAARRRIGIVKPRGYPKKVKQSKYCEKMAERFRADGNLEAYQEIYK